MESREGDSSEDHVEHGDHTDERAQKNQEDLHSDAVPEHERILCSLPPVGVRVGSIARERSRAFSEAPADVPGIEVGAGEKADGEDRSDDVMGCGDRKHVEFSHARWRAGCDRMGVRSGSRNDRIRSSDRGPCVARLREAGSRAEPHFWWTTDWGFSERLERETPFSGTPRVAPAAGCRAKNSRSSI